MPPSSQPSRQASLRIAGIWPRRSSRPRAEWIVFDACSITRRLCSTGHFATRDDIDEGLVRGAAHP